MFSFFQAFSQPQRYTVANAHSHNDYEQDIPLMRAYRAGFGSIEADIFLQNGQLLVAHEKNDLNTHRTLQHLYLDSLNTFAVKNNGYPYADHTKKLLLLIDIKTEAVPTLAKLTEVLQQYPALIESRNMLFVISGNRPPETAFTSYPAFISFDGVVSASYGEDALQRIALMSDNLANYTQWDGRGKIKSTDWKKLKAVVAKMHALGKPVRFWNAPDTENAWRQLVKLGVDYINTDHINELAAFFMHSLSLLPR
jgi:alkaline phosphatase